LQLIHAALYSLPRQETALVRSELLGLESRAYARFGRREAANAVRSAEACVEVYNEAAHEPVPDWMHYMKQAEVDCLAANAYIELALSADDRPRRPAYAERAQTHTLSACRTRTNGYTRSRVFDEIRLAKVRLAQDEPVESAMVAVGCLERAEHLRSNIVVEWFIRFNHRLTSQYPTVPEATAFRQQLREYVRRAAPQREREVVGSATV
jgi:hypothetical protein